MLRTSKQLSLLLVAAMLGASCAKAPQKTEPTDRVISSESLDRDEAFAPIESNAKIKYPWPSNYEVVDIEEMTENLIKELHNQFDLKPKKVPLGSIAWDGTKKLEYTLSQRDVSLRFSRASLNLHRERGREPLDVLMWTFIHIGMDEGIKDFNHGSRVTKIRDNVNALETFLRDPQNSSKEISIALDELNTGLKGISDSPEIVMVEMRNIPTKTLEEVNARALVEILEGYYMVNTKGSAPAKDALLKFFLSYFEVVKEQGIRLQLRDNRTILSLEQRVIDKSYSDFKKNGSLSKNDIEFLKATLGQLRERLN